MLFNMAENISIHALLAESDTARAAAGCALSYFYPRSPCGERLYGDDNVTGTLAFLSTLSLRRATHGREASSPREKISIHALLAESDDSPACAEVRSLISIHALLAESDARLVADNRLVEFLSTLSLRRATQTVMFFSAGL